MSKTPKMVTYAAPIGTRQPSPDPMVTMVMFPDELAVDIGQQTRYFSHEGLAYKGMTSGAVSHPETRPGKSARFSVPKGTTVWANGIYLVAAEDFLVVCTPDTNVLFEREGLNFAGYDHSRSVTGAEHCRVCGHWQLRPGKDGAEHRCSDYRQRGGPVAGGIFGLSSAGQLAKEIYGLTVVVSAEAPDEPYDVEISDDAAIDLYERAVADGHLVRGWPMATGRYRLSIE